MGSEELRLHLKYILQLPEQADISIIGNLFIVNFKTQLFSQQLGIIKSITAQSQKTTMLFQCKSTFHITLVKYRRASVEFFPEFFLFKKSMTLISSQRHLAQKKCLNKANNLCEQVCIDYMQ